MKKILFVYDRMMTGGTTTALLSLLSEFDYDKYSVDLQLFDFEGEFFDKIPEMVNVLPKVAKREKKYIKIQKLIMLILSGAIWKVLWLYYKYRNTHKGNLRLILMHYGALMQVGLSGKVKEEYDAAISFIEGWSGHYVLSNKIKAKKKVVWFHPDYEASYLIPEIDKKSLSRADAIITVSKHCQENMINVFPEYKEKIKVIENITSYKFINERAAEHIDAFLRGMINVCTVARCDIQVKGLDRIIDALKRLKKENLLDGVVWHYIGAGPQLEELAKLVKENNLEDNVVLYGQKNNPLPYLKQMDAFILASRYEGKPVSVEEALALEKPCIVTEYASAREQIEDEKNGIVVKNSSEGVYEGLKKYIGSESIRRSLEEGAKNIKYNENAAEVIKLYQLI